MNATQPLKLLLVDDEAPARLRIKVLLADLAQEQATELCYEAEQAAAALAWLEAGNAVDVVLADIHMPGMDGLELARRLHALPKPPAVIFTTAFEQHAVAAFDLNVVDYLLKPIRASRLSAALSKARQLAGVRLGSTAELETRRHLTYTERGRILKVAVADVLYLRAELKYVTARTREKEYLLDESLAHLEQEFPQRFVRIHRNCLVARDAIRGFEKLHEEGGEGQWQVLLNDLDERLPVSRRQWPMVKNLA